MPLIFYISYIVLWVFVVIQAILLLLIYRHFGLMSMGTLEGVQRDGLPLGEVAPVVSGVTAQGEELVWEVQSGKSHLVLFAAPGCEPCEQVLPSINQLGEATNAHIDGLIVVPGQRDAAEQLVAKFHPPFPCLAEDGSGAFDRYRVRVTPFAFVIGEDRRIRAKGLCNDPIRLRDLLIAGGVESAAMLLNPTLPPVQTKSQQDRVKEVVA